MNPDPEALFHRALEHQRAASPAAAEALYRQILALAPDNVASLNNLGLLLKEQGALEDAGRLFVKAIGHAPGHAPSYTNLAATLMALGRIADAAEIASQALALDPNSADAHNNLGAAARGAGRFGDALRHYRRALALDPHHAAALENLGDALQAAGEVDEAQRCYEAAYALTRRGALRIKRALMLPAVYRSQAELDAWRRRFAANLAALAADPPTLADVHAELNDVPFYLAYQGHDDAELMAHIAALYAPAPRSGAPIDPAGGAIPRVGLLSSHWHNHSVGHCYRQSASVLAREGLEVVLFDSSLAPAPERAGTADGVRVRRLARNLAMAQAAVKGENLDALIYADIGFDSFSYCLALTRLAPLQGVFNGHPATTGLPAIDVFFSAASLIAPASQEHFTEELVALDWFPGVFARPRPLADPPGRAALGLPVAARLYVCPMMLFKIHPAMDEALHLILERDPEARLVFFADRYAPRFREILEQRLAATLAPHAGRVLFRPFAPLPEFRAILHAADVVLDSFPFGGGTTSLLAFAHALPIVTLRTPLVRGRYTAACYEAMGIEGGIAETPADYAAKAVHLASDSAAGARMRRMIAERSEVLFDNDTGARALARWLKAHFAARAGGRHSRAAG